MANYNAENPITDPLWYELRDKLIYLKKELMAPAHGMDFNDKEKARRYLWHINNGLVIIIVKPQSASTILKDNVYSKFILKAENILKGYREFLNGQQNIN